jgi:oxygen-independent coproporphyrinogen-3 oxidase
MMRADTVGLYIHIPFCARKCLYCDFCSFEGSDEALREAYTEALCREIAAWRAPLETRVVDTVYIGGGTPSMLSVRQTARILEALHAAFLFAPQVEVTSEVNPATADAEKLRAWHALGVNRLSIGVQSFSDRELTALGRLHTADEAEKFVHLARTCGFEDLSLDLMYGITGQTPESFGATLTRATALEPTHISAYSLKVEPGTPFSAMGDRLVLPDEDTEVDMYESCVSTLASHGYRHYEISNYAKAGYECRHNLRYWTMQEYVGFGVAAYSFFGGRRFGCDRDLKAYLGRDFSHMPPSSEAPLTEAELESDTVMLGLRLGDGIGEETFRRRFGYGFYEKYGARLAPYLAHGLVHFDGQRTALTDRGMYVSLALLCEILD